MSRKFGEQDSRVIKAEFDVWLSRDISFNNPPGQKIKKYVKYTKCKKVKYTKSILKYLDTMEDADCLFVVHSGRACAIELDGQVRYVWRSDLLNEREYEPIQKKNADRIRNLLKKS